MQTYRILAIGDSVVWGQGVLDEHKFSALTRDNVASRLGQSLPGQFDVVLEVLAHSGAVTSGISPAGPRLYGEIPLHDPSVEQQVASLIERESRDDIRLILMNGGANDVDVSQIISPAMTPEAIRTQTHAACYERMYHHVRSALNMCPNAEVILTGYYQALTEFSSLGSAEFEAFVVNFFGVAKSPDFLQGLRLALTDPAQTETWKQAMIDNGDVFKQAVDDAFTALANDLNHEMVTLGGQPRVHFVPSGFAPINGAFCGVNSYIWVPNAAAMVSDEVFTARKQAIDAFAGSTSPSPIDAGPAYRAAVGHPNVLGHQCYAHSILTALDDVLRHQGLLAGPPEAAETAQV